VTWLLHVIKQDDGGKWSVQGDAFTSEDAAVAEGERLKVADPTVRDYKVTRAN
jgi:hypothetical protein